MRLDDVLARLEPLPDPLPAGPPSLMPLLHGHATADGPLVRALAPDERA